MSSPAHDAASFVPYEPLSGAAIRGADGGFQLKVVPAGDPGSAHSAPFPHTPAPGSPASMSQPVVTLQREGDKVTGIRIACVCGQVIELACSY